MAKNNIIRDDLTNKLIHFTKGTQKEAIFKFQSILSQRTLIGGSGYIKGAYNCVCFTESPIAKFPYILARPDIFDFRYAPLGIMVDKTWLFEQGGRPVIYQTETEFDLLDEKHRYRHKTYDPVAGIDFTWEREWRICIEQLPIEPCDVTVIVPNRSYEQKLVMEHTLKTRRTVSVLGNVAPIRPIEWHFIALEDLGVTIPGF